jgi:hypothetical protein
MNLHPIKTKHHTETKPFSSPFQFEAWGTPEDCFGGQIPKAPASDVWSAILPRDPAVSQPPWCS